MNRKRESKLLQPHVQKDITKVPVETRSSVVYRKTLETKREPPRTMPGADRTQVP